MVDVQSVSITLAALSFLVAATYYAMNIREQRRNRRLTLTTTILQPFMTVETAQLIMDILNMEWEDLEDFQKKYDHRMNPGNWAKRFALWNTFENIGTLYREGLLDLETLYRGSQGIISLMWYKFKPVIEMFRESGDYAEKSYDNFEYVAEKLDEFVRTQGGRGNWGDVLFHRDGEEG